MIKTILSSISLTHMHAMFIGGVIMLMMLITILGILKIKSKEAKQLPVIILLALTILLVVLGVNTNKRIKYGAHYNELYAATPIWEIQEIMKNSPILAKQPKSENGKIIILTKFGCPDCQATHNQTKTMLKDFGEIYWISSESEYGQSLVNEFKITHVPTALYFYNEPEDHFTRAAKFPLAIKIGDDITVDLENMEHLINVIVKDRQ